MTVINLGDKVKDKITGLTGIVIAKTEWLYGCERVTVQPQEGKDGKPADAFGLDTAQCEVLEASVVKGFKVPAAVVAETAQPAARRAGPTADPQRSADPAR